MDLASLEEIYLKLTDPREIVKDMSYDDFMDWLDLAEDSTDIECAIPVFEEVGLKQHVQIMRVYLKMNYSGE